MRKILPFEINPYAKSYYLHAFTLGIIQASGKDIMPWLMTDFFNFQYTKDADGMFIINTDDAWSINKKIIYPQQIVMFSNNICEDNFDILKIIKNMINKRAYVYGFFNECYIPNTLAYQRFNFDHDYLIYGYDDEEKMFYAAGYNKHKEYLSYKISYTDYLNSIQNTQHGITDIRFYTFDDKYEFSFDKKGFITQLNDYINGTRSFTVLGLSDESEYGLVACKRLAQYLNDCKEYQTNVDLRYSRSFAELKSLMLLRIGYLNSNKFVDCMDIYNAYKNIEKSADSVHLLCLKYNISRNTSCLDRAVDIINKITDEESELLKMLINSCEQSFNEC